LVNDLVDLDLLRERK